MKRILLVVIGLIGFGTNLAHAQEQLNYLRFPLTTAIHCRPGGVVFDEPYRHMGWSLEFAEMTSHNGVAQPEGTYLLQTSYVNFVEVEDHGTDTMHLDFDADRCSITLTQTPNKQDSRVEISLANLSKAPWGSEFPASGSLVVDGQEVNMQNLHCYFRFDWAQQLRDEYIGQCQDARAQRMAPIEPADSSGNDGFVD